MTVGRVGALVKNTHRKLHRIIRYIINRVNTANDLLRYLHIANPQTMFVHAVILNINHFKEYNVLFSFQPST